MYFISENQRLDKKEDPMLDRLISMNLIDPFTHEWNGVGKLNGKNTRVNQKISKIIKDLTVGNTSEYPGLQVNHLNRIA